jgi:hypothetical protein
VQTARTVVPWCSAVQCSAVQCSAVQCSVVQCSAVQCSAVTNSVPELSAAAIVGLCCLRESTHQDCLIQERRGGDNSTASATRQHSCTVNKQHRLERGTEPVTSTRTRTAIYEDGNRQISVDRYRQISVDCCNSREDVATSYYVRYSSLVSLYLGMCHHISPSHGWMINIAHASRTEGIATHSFDYHDPIYQHHR